MPYEKPKKISSAELVKILFNLRHGSPKAIGSYLFGKYRVAISEYGLSTSDRVSRLYEKRRNSGQCIYCGEKVFGKNPKTGQPYRLCDEHKRILEARRKKR